MHSINQAEKFYGEKYDIVVQLMANCPLRGSNEIIDAYNSFIKSDVNSQISCFAYGWMNPWWAHKLNNKKPMPLFEEAIQRRSQDLEELYCPTGAIWIAKSEILKLKKNFYTGNHSFHLMAWKTAMDIDNYEDLEMAKALYCLLSHNS